MTREEVKKLLPIMQAFADGKTIQIKGRSRWADLCEPDFSCSPNDYRIKPELKYRPFKNQEECWNEMLKHRPLGWLKKPNGELLCIGNVFDEGVAYRYSICQFEECLDGNYTFVDGTPFGIKEE